MLFIRNILHGVPCFQSSDCPQCKLKCDCVLKTQICDRCCGGTCDAFITLLKYLLDNDDDCTKCHDCQKSAQTIKVGIFQLEYSDRRQQVKTLEASRHSLPCVHLDRRFKSMMWQMHLNGAVNATDFPICRLSLPLLRCRNVRGEMCGEHADPEELLNLPKIKLACARLWIIRWLSCAHSLMQKETVCMRWQTLASALCCQLSEATLKSSAASASSCGCRGTRERVSRLIKQTVTAG